MTKSELKELIAINEDIPKIEAERYIDAVFDAIKEGLRKDGKVAIHKTLIIEVRDTNAQSGTINGTAWSKPAGKKIVVKVSENFEEDVLGE